MTESALIRDGGSGSLSLRLVSFDEGLRYAGQYAYRMESPTMKQGGRLHLHGVSEVTALADGRLVVLEREVRIPKGVHRCKGALPSFSLSIPVRKTPLMRVLT